MDDLQQAEEGAARRGRPPGTSRRTLEVIALRLFTEQGFDETPIEQIAAEAGVSRRTFFRYFDSKASVLWGEFDSEISVIREALAQVPDSVPMMDAIRQAVVTANHYRADDVRELRARMNLIASAPALQSSAAVHYDAWERVVSEFVAVPHRAAARVAVPADRRPVHAGRLPRRLRAVERARRRRPDRLPGRGAGRAGGRLLPRRDDVRRAAPGPDDRARQLAAAGCHRAPLPDPRCAQNMGWTWKFRAAAMLRCGT